MRRASVQVDPPCDGQADDASSGVAPGRAGPPGVPDRGSQKLASERARRYEAGVRTPSAVCTASDRLRLLVPERRTSAGRWTSRATPYGLAAAFAACASSIMRIAR